MSLSHRFKKSTFTEALSCTTTVAWNSSRKCFFSFCGSVNAKVGTRRRTKKKNERQVRRNKKNQFLALIFFQSLRTYILKTMKANAHLAWEKAREGKCKYLKELVDTWQPPYILSWMYFKYQNSNGVSIVM